MTLCIEYREVLYVYIYHSFKGYKFFGGFGFSDFTKWFIDLNIKFFGTESSFDIIFFEYFFLFFIKLFEFGVSLIKFIKIIILHEFPKRGFRPELIDFFGMITGTIIISIELQNLFIFSILSKIEFRYFEFEFIKVK